MIKIENFEVVGWEHAIRGMRNPKNSWERSDSGYGCNLYGNNIHCRNCNVVEKGSCMTYRDFEMGKNDHELMMKLAKGGSVHAKYRRMIVVYMDITAPLYWWKEFDTYKVGTVANSCSTMHKIHEKEFTLDDFSWDQLLNTGCGLFEVTTKDGLFTTNVQPLGIMTHFMIPALNVCREKFLETNDKKYWHQMIQLLPSSYNQKRTIMLNYEVLAGIYSMRKNHKLDEWVEFCKWIEGLPYSELILAEDVKNA